MRVFLKRFKISIPYTVCLLIVGVIVGAIGEAAHDHEAFGVFGDIVDFGKYVHSILPLTENT